MARYPGEGEGGHDQGAAVGHVGNCVVAVEMVAHEAVVVDETLTIFLRLLT